MNPIDFMRGLDAGDWPTWLSFFTSTGALIAAAAATLFAGRTWRREQQRERERQLEAQAAQAVQVTVEPARTQGYVDLHLDTDGEAHERVDVPAIRIRNESGQLIYDVTILWPHSQAIADAAYAGDFTNLDPRAATDLIRRNIIGFLRPGETTLPVTLDTFDLPEKFLGIDSPIVNDPDVQDALLIDDSWAPVRTAVLKGWEFGGTPSIAFTDAAGRRWIRRRDGRLEHDHNHRPEPRDDNEVDELNHQIEQLRAKRKFNQS